MKSSLRLLLRVIILRHHDIGTIVWASIRIGQSWFTNYSHTSIKSDIIISKHFQTLYVDYSKMTLDKHYSLPYWIKYYLKRIFVQQIAEGGSCTTTL